MKRDETQTNPTSISLANIICINPDSTYAFVFSSIRLPLKTCFSPLQLPLWP